MKAEDKLDEVAAKKTSPQDKIIELIYTHLSMIKETVVRNGNLRAEFFRNIWMVEKVRKLLDVLEAGWKRQRPWNRGMVQAREKQMLVTYLSPMLLGLEEPMCRELAEQLRDAWNARRPKDAYDITSYARLQEGFRNVILGIDLTGWQRRREERDS